MKSGKAILNENGFSLLELIVVLIIMGTISAIAYGVILLNARTFGTLSEEISSRWDLRKTLTIMRKDFTELDPNNIISSIKGKKASSKLIFTNLDGDKIRYLYNNSNLRRKVGSSHWEVLLKNVVEAPFEYYDSDMKPTKNINDLSYIKVKLVTNENGKKRSVEDIFFLRNRTLEQPNMSSKSNEKKENDHKKNSDNDKDHKDDDSDHHKNK